MLSSITRQFLVNRFLFLIMFMGVVCQAQAENWSELQAEVVRGADYELFGGDNTGTGSPDDSAITTFTLESTTGSRYGTNWFYVDITFDDEGSQDNNTWFMEVSQQLSSEYFAKKLFGAELEWEKYSWGILKDVNFLVGMEASDGEPSSGVLDARKPYAGVSVNLNLPYFTFFGVQVARMKDFNESSDRGTFWNAALWYRLPVYIGPTKWKVEGFADWEDGADSKGPCLPNNFINPPCNVTSSWFTQHQVLLDLGYFWGNPEELFVGAEIQLTQNLYGVQTSSNFHRDELFASAMVEWTF